MVYGSWVCQFGKKIALGSTGDIELFAKYYQITTSMGISDKNIFSFYPNPSTNYIYSDLEISSLTITNLEGVIVTEFNYQKSRYNISNLNPDIYFIKAVDGRGKVYEGKLRKE